MSDGRHSLVIGVVSDLADPENLGRVRVRYPHLADEKSDWARLVSPMAGKERGFFMKPEVGDEVLIGFEHDDPRRPLFLGGMWSSADTPPPSDGSATDNDWRFIRSRSGHLIILDDKKGGERIEIIDKDGALRVVIDSVGRKIQVECDVGDVEVKAGAGTVSIEALNIEMKATANLKLEAGASLSLKAPQIAIN